MSLQNSSGEIVWKNMIDILKSGKNVEIFSVLGAPAFFLLQNKILGQKYLIYESSLLVNPGI